MKTENMKLLDLQTGKCPELGKDWLYGGDSVYLIERLEGCLKFHNKWLVSLIDTALKYEHNPNQRNISYELAQKVVDNQAKTENEVVKSQSESGLINKSEPPLELKEICEKVGAVVYGGRYVLIENEYCGDVLFVKDRFDYWNEFYSVCKSDGTLTNQRLGDWITKVIGNLFEEYSKQLRKEESKFDELMEKLK